MRALDLHLSDPQLEVFHCPERFRILVAGRRFGKTQLALVELIRSIWTSPDATAWYVAPTYRQAKRIAWQRLKDLLRGDDVSISETDLAIRLEGAGSIALRGADNYDSLRGNSLDFVVLDEFAGMQPEVWSEALRPALADRQGRALFIGTPQGHNHLYDRFQYAQSHREWAAFHFKTIDGGNVTQEELLSAAEELDQSLYRQEFEASFESTAIGRAYHAFRRELNVRPCQYSAGSNLIWSLDFNVNPMCSVIAQRAGETIEVLNELVLPDANTWLTCERFWQLVQPFRHHRALTIEIYGDASGYQRRTSASSTDWQLIRQFFAQLHGQAAIHIHATGANPGVRDRVNLVNSRLLSASGDTRLFIDPKCKQLIEDLERVCWRADHFGQATTELDKSDRLRTHTSDALGYYLAQAFPMWPKIGERPERLL